MTGRAQRDPDVFKSLSIWNRELVNERWTTMAPVPGPSGDFFIFFCQSPWQREKMLQHGRGMLMLDSSTNNTVQNCFSPNGKKVCLYTVMIRDPLVGKGLPIAWALTTSMTEQSIATVLAWLRTSTGVVPQAVMSDYSLAVTKAVSEIYSDLGKQAPKHYWCLFQVLNAFRRQAKTFLQDRAEEAVDDFRQIVYSPSSPDPLLKSFFIKWEPECPEFVEHVKTQWQEHIVHWAVFFRTSAHQGIFTNNYTKAWRRVLASDYFSSTESRRIDEVLQILVDEVLMHYQWLTRQVEYGVRRQQTSRFQLEAKTISEGYTKAILDLLGIGMFRTSSHFFISSFTNPTSRAYAITIDKPGRGSIGQLTRCNCEHYTRYGSACKHMYYLAREYRMHVVESALIPLEALVVDPTLEINIQTLIKPSINILTLTKEVDSDEEIGSYGQLSNKRKLFIDLVVGPDPDPLQFTKRPRLDSLSLSPQSSHTSNETIPGQDENLDPNLFTD
ncbi:hypothetical protein PGT21_031284 [Puccinia graminis f. sp. tritici]|uniref:SWIM-type domain-containing protein n=1 Tax=Puccinia graminis f. sp. tritici TaxID=56615 RepID=A0A5B0QXV8_PUCGR|nr:hypothetical protein PGT21_031284 [Puccinia graminis f. sp. tritici]